MFADAKDLPDAASREVHENIDAFNRLRGEFYDKLKEIDQTMDELKQKVRDNIKTPQRPKGLLTRDEKRYLDCLGVKKQELETLF